MALSTHKRRRSAIAADLFISSIAQELLSTRSPRCSRKYRVTRGDPTQVVDEEVDISPPESRTRCPAPSPALPPTALRAEEEEEDLNSDSSIIVDIAAAIASVEREAQQRKADEEREAGEEREQHAVGPALTLEQHEYILRTADIMMEELQRRERALGRYPCKAAHIAGESVAPADCIYYQCPAVYQDM